MKSASIPMTDDQLNAIAEVIADKVWANLQQRLEPAWVTKSEFAKRHRVSVRTVERWLNEGKAETKKIGGRVLVGKVNQ